MSPTSPVRLGQFSKVEHLHFQVGSEVFSSYSQAQHGLRIGLGEVADVDLYAGGHTDLETDLQAYIGGIGGAWYGTGWTAITAVDFLFPEGGGDMEIVGYWSVEYEW